MCPHFFQAFYKPSSRSKVFPRLNHWLEFLAHMREAEMFEHNMLHDTQLEKALYLESSSRRGVR